VFRLLPLRSFLSRLSMPGFASSLAVTIEPRYSAAVAYFSRKVINEHATRMLFSSRRVRLHRAARSATEWTKAGVADNATNELRATSKPMIRFALNGSSAWPAVTS
jgi:hypothetical protein